MVRHSLYRVSAYAVVGTPRDDEPWVAERANEVSEGIHILLSLGNLAGGKTTPATAACFGKLQVVERWRRGDAKRVGTDATSAMRNSTSSVSRTPSVIGWTSWLDADAAHRHHERRPARRHAQENRPVHGAGGPDRPADRIQGYDLRARRSAARFGGLGHATKHLRAP